MTDLLTLAREVGFSQCAAVNMDALDPLEAVRDMCKADRCGRYGKSWSCPPACSTLEQARAQIKRYSQGILVQSARQARLLFPHCLPLTAGTCTLCHTCTYPDRPCRHPKQRLSSMEAYGLFVSDVCVRSNLAYNYGPRTLTYTACVLY